MNCLAVLVFLTICCPLSLFASQQQDGKNGDENCNVNFNSEDTSVNGKPFKHFRIGYAGRNARRHARRGQQQQEATCQCGLEQISHSRVINGKPARRGQYPWMAYVQSTIGSCGGSVINDRFIMTAAHCVKNVKSPDQFQVTLHAYKTEDFETLPHSKVSRVLMHPEYTGIDSFNDIALLELEEPLTFNQTFMPICIPNSNDYDNLVVAGWGLMNVWILKVTPPTLREADLNEVSTEQCNEFYEAIDGEKVICAGGEKGSCQGDSGGPLMTRKNGQTYQAGIVSFGGADCGIIMKTPSVFERPTAHIEWIKENTQGAKWCSAPDQAIQ